MEVCSWYSVVAVIPTPATTFESLELFGSFVVETTAALRPPIASGLKVTAIEQDPPAGITTVQLLVWEKSLGFDPLIVMPLS